MVTFVADGPHRDKAAWLRAEEVTRYCATIELKRTNVVVSERIRQPEGNQRNDFVRVLRHRLAGHGRERPGRKAAGSRSRCISKQHWVPCTSTSVGRFVAKERP